MTQPVAMRMAEFWMVCSLVLEVGLVFVNQIGAAYVKSEPIRDLKVINMVSFCCPQFVPVSSFRIFRRGLAFFTIASTCLWKKRWGSKVTPRILGCLSSGSGDPFSGTVGWEFYCWNWGVNRVMVDFRAEIIRFLS